MASTPHEIHRSLCLLQKKERIERLIAIVEEHQDETVITVTMAGGGVSEEIKFHPKDPYQSDLAKLMDDYLQKMREIVREELKELGVDADAK